MVSEALVASGDENFAEEWKQFFDAATLVDEDEGASEADDQDSMREERMAIDLPDISVGGWYRAVLPPVTPLGVVA